MTTIEIQFRGYNAVKKTLPLSESPFENVQSVDEANAIIDQTLQGDADSHGWIESEANGESFQVREFSPENLKSSDDLIALAIGRTNAHKTPIGWTYLANETGSHWVCTDSEMELLGEMLDSGQDDAYSLWCAEGNGFELQIVVNDVDGDAVHTLAHGSTREVASQLSADHPAHDMIQKLIATGEPVSQTFDRDGESFTVRVAIVG